MSSSNKIIMIVILSLASISGATTHKGISFQGVIKLPSGEYPTRSGVEIRGLVLSPDDCILRDEKFTGVNISSGYVNLVIGAGVTYSYDPGLAFTAIMDNSSTFTGLTCINSDGSTTVRSFDPSTSNGSRKFRLSLTIDSTAVVADFNMRATAFAVNAETLNGKSDSALVNINSSKSLTQSNIESIFERYVKLDALLNNTDSSGTSLGVNVTGSAANVTGTVAIANGGTGATSASDARTNLGLGTLATISPSGTADSTTYLRGDGTWASVTTGVTSESDPTVQTFAKNAPGTGLTVDSSQLTVTYGTTAGTAAQGDDTRITNAFDSTTSLSGDLTGTLPSPVVAKIKGQTVASAATTAGQILRFSSSSTWVPTFLTLTDLRSPLTGTAALPSACTAGQTLTWTAVNDALTCSTISITVSQISDFPTLATSATTDTTNASNITSGTLSASRLPSSITDALWTSDGSSGVYRSGSVGIGTSAPATSLHIVGTDNASLQLIDSYGSSNTPSPKLTFRSARLSGSTQAASQSGDPLFIVSGRGSVGTSFSSVGKAEVAGYAEEAWSSSATGAYLAFSTTASAGTSTTEKMRISGTGYVGIGTTAPAYGLSIVGDGSAADDIGIDSFSSTTGAGPGIFQNRARGTSSVPLAVASNDVIGYFGFRAYDGSAYQSAAGVLVRAENAWTTTSSTKNAYFGFNTMSAGVNAERMRITSGGYVGIGTTTPSKSLHIEGTNDGEIGAKLVNLSSGTSAITAFTMTSNAKSGGIAYFGPGWSSGTYAQEGTVELVSYSGNTGGVQLRTSTSAPILFRTNQVERMRVSATGYVGIGESSPSYPLDVAGDIHASGNVIAGSTTLTSDERFKKNIVAVDDALSRLLNLQGVTYDWRVDEFPSRHFNTNHQMGVIAQDVQKQFPESVITDNEGYLSVNYSSLIAPVIESIRTLYAKITGVDQEVKELKKENQAMKEALCRLGEKDFCKTAENTSK